MFKLLFFVTRWSMGETWYSYQEYMPWLLKTSTVFTSNSVKLKRNGFLWRPLSNFQYFLALILRLVLQKWVLNLWMILRQFIWKSVVNSRENLLHLDKMFFFCSFQMYNLWETLFTFRPLGQTPQGSSQGSTLQLPGLHGLRHALQTRPVITEHPQ